MQSLGDLFAHVRASLASKTAEKQDMLTAISTVVPEVLTIKCLCEIKNNTLYIRTHPALKNKIITKQEDILLAIKKWNIKTIR
jgi:hypothetical protein